jgi:hypothetical protein
MRSILSKTRLADLDIVRESIISSWLPFGRAVVVTRLLNVVLTVLERREEETFRDYKKY